MSEETNQEEPKNFAEVLKEKRAKIGSEVIYTNQKGDKQPGKVVHVYDETEFRDQRVDLFVMTRKGSCVVAGIPRSISLTGTEGSWCFNQEIYDAGR